MSDGNCATSRRKLWSLNHIDMYAQVLAISFSRDITSAMRKKLNNFLNENFPVGKKIATVGSKFFPLSVANKTWKKYFQNRSVSFGGVSILLYRATDQST